MLFWFQIIAFLYLFHNLNPVTAIYLLNNNLITNNSPVILVPGDGGSQAWGTQNGEDFMIWIRLYYIVRPNNFNFYFKLKYDPITKLTNESNEDVAIYIPGWGDTKTVEHLSYYNTKESNYFHELVESLVRKNSYERNVTIRGAPYDFRKTPKENTEFVDKMKLLVEETYINAGYKRVYMLGHSMGNLYLLHFFSKMTVKWKKQFIRGYIATSAPLGGATKALQTEVSGTSLIGLSSSLTYRGLERSFPSMAWLLPREPAFNSTIPIITTQNRNYTIRDYKTLFEDIGFPDGYSMYENNKDLVKTDDTPEGIDEIFCIYSSSQPTAETYKYGKGFPDVDPTVTYGKGDGTVNMSSLELCKKWENVQVSIIKDSGHKDILEKSEFIDLIRNILVKKYPNVA